MGVALVDQAEYDLAECRAALVTKEQAEEDARHLATAVRDLTTLEIKDAISELVKLGAWHDHDHCR
jgi:hypothetical protein